MDFLSINDLSKDQIGEIFGIASDLFRGSSSRHIPSHTAVVLLFEKPSTRTHVSFAVAVEQLGGAAIYVDAKTTQMSRGEPLSDTARVLSRYANLIVMRTFEQAKLEDLAKFSSVPVINALSDLEHPTQALADLYTVLQKKRKFEGLKLACIGDIQNNTFNSLMLAATKMGIEVSLVGPAGVKPIESVFAAASEQGKISVHSDVEGGLSGADIIYTDTFVSMGQEGDAEARKRLFAPYILDGKALAYAKPDAIVMHPLPAHRGEEIMDGVIEGAQSVVFDEAENKLLLAKAIILFLLG